MLMYPMGNNNSATLNKDTVVRARQQYLAWRKQRFIKLGAQRVSDEWSMAHSTIGAALKFESDTEV